MGRPLSAAEADRALWDAFSHHDHYAAMCGMLAIAKANGNVVTMAQAHSVPHIRYAVDAGKLSATLDELVCADQASWFRFENGVFVRKVRDEDPNGIVVRRTNSHGSGLPVDVFVPEHRVTPSGRLRMDDACRIVLEIIRVLPGQRVLLANLGSCLIRAGPHKASLAKVLPDSISKLSELIAALSDKVVYDNSSRATILLRGGGTTEAHAAPTPASAGLVPFPGGPTTAVAGTHGPLSGSADHATASVGSPAVRKGPPMPKVRTFAQPAAGSDAASVSSERDVPLSHDGALRGSGYDAGGVGSARTWSPIGPSDLLPSAPHDASDSVFWPAEWAFVGEGDRGECGQGMRGALLLSRGEVDAAGASPCGLLGSLITSDADDGAVPPRDCALYLSTGAPFSLVVTGSNGADVSHTVTAALEGATVHFPPHIRADAAPLAVVFQCGDASGISAYAAMGERSSAVPDAAAVPEEIVVLTSPSCYSVRKQQYAAVQNCTVSPLLFSWSSLSFANLKSLLRLDVESEGDLVSAAVLNILRQSQKLGVALAYDDLKRALSQLVAQLPPPQVAALTHRFRTLDLFLYEQPENQAIRGAHHVRSVLTSGAAGARRLIVVDLADPMLAVADVRAVFDVVLSMLASAQPSRKIAVFDGVHRYLDPAGDTLSRKLVSIAREGALSLIVGSESPRHVPGDLYAGASAVVLHRFHARSWFAWLQAHLPLVDTDFAAVMALAACEGLVFSLDWSPTVLGWRVGLVSRSVRHARVRPLVTKCRAKAVGLS